MQVGSSMMLHSILMYIQQYFTDLYSARTKTHSVRDHRGRGIRSVTSLKQDRYIVSQHLRNRFIHATTTAAETISTNNRPISANTVRRRLRGQNSGVADFMFWSCFYHPSLSTENRELNFGSLLLLLNLYRSQL